MLNGVCVFVLIEADVVELSQNSTYWCCVDCCLLLIRLSRPSRHSNI